MPTLAHTLGLMHYTASGWRGHWQTDHRYWSVCALTTYITAFALENVSVYAAVCVGSAGDPWLVGGDVQCDSWRRRLHRCWRAIWSQRQSSWQRKLLLLLYQAFSNSLPVKAQFKWLAVTTAHGAVTDIEWSCSISGPCNSYRLQ